MANINEDDNKLVLYADSDDDWLDKESYCACCDVPIEEVNDDAFYDWVRSCKETYLEDMREALLENLPNEPVIIEGKVWTIKGMKEITPVIVTDDSRDSNVWAAIKKCSNVGGDANVTIALNTDTGALEIAVAHHDGTNSFTVRQINWISYGIVNWILAEGEDDEHKYSDIIYDEFTPDQFEL